ncbi:Tyrosine--tRNA ligase [Posidoniimonas polymericola]|uniref:Tyrosine--tRNA ligase n=1 Tax=Posidoniimonas polymericola TaxID=2528002 RepID=A0A5C5YQL0_9BACT|nr:tyrosine--tRNA ligase [Posidoniimonas polymericola]TWT77040.1 Tyrosine--tRNA ligase [Posidoniimonas polymericola]
MNPRNATRMRLYDDLKWRGLIHQTTDDGLADWLEAKPRTVYAGFDPTADSLHVGSLLGLLVLRRFQQAGHQPIAVVGGATGMIGDPSGKSAERNLLDREQLAANVEGMGAQMRRFLDFDCGDSSASLLNNHDWTAGWSYLEFLRDIGKNFPVNVMLGKDSVKSRLGGDAGLSYTEFSYMLLQAYDFVWLNQNHGCELQAGGSDQWGNITAGIDLARRMHGQQLYGVTWPLLTKSDGTKMGKTEGGAIWLSADRTSPYEFFQYWRNVDDADVGGCLRMLTELSHEEIESLDKSREADAAKRESQVRLAEELTRLVHGDEGLAVARRATEIFFGAEIAELDDKQLGSIFADVPSSEVPKARLAGEGLGVLEAFSLAGLAKSNGEARRTVSAGGAYVNNRRVEDPTQQLTATDLASETVMVLRSGKKRYALLRFVE